MSNWTICYPSNPIAEGAINMFWLMSTNIVPHESANCKVQVQYQNGALATEFVNIVQPEYTEWGNDDNWLYEKISKKLALGSLTNPNISN
jgi:hypothetical protein